MPPLRPLPSQTLRPAWSAGQFCRGPAAAAAARLPRPHSFLGATAAPDTRSFASTSDHGVNEGMKDVGGNGASKESENGIAPTDPAAGDGAQHSGKSRGRARVGENLDPLLRPMYVMRSAEADFFKAADPKLDRKRNAAIRKAQRGKLLRKHATVKDPHRKARGAPQESAREMDRLQRLARMGSSLEADISRSDGQRIGAITKDTISDDSTWKRMKKDLSEVAEADSSPVTWKRVKLRLNLQPEAQESGLEAQVREPEPKPDPFVCEAGRPIPTKQISTGRQAFPKISATGAEGLGAQEGAEDVDMLADVSIKPRKSRPVEFREGVTPVKKGKDEAYATAEIEGAEDTDYASPGVTRPIRYLSRDPSRPLPHTTGQAIPPDMFGLRTGPDPEGITSQHGPRPGSQLDGEVPESQASQGNEDTSEDAVHPTNPSLVDEILSKRPNFSSNTKHKQSASLLGELFPELAERSQDQRAPQDEREVPKLSLDFQDQKIERRPQYLQRKEFIDRQMQAKYLNELVVIKLSGVSKYLSEEDIKRLVPSSSKYIEGWTDPDFIKAFPARDEQTLERLDQYYILFRNVRAARDFQQNIRKLHFSVLCPTPSPGFTDANGVDLDAALNSYTIGPPISNTIYCSVVPSPYPRHLRQIFLAGGYEPIVDHASLIDPTTGAAIPETTVSKVLFHVEGAQPSLGDVRNTIARDGKDRWLTWAIVGGTNGGDGIVRLTTHYSRNEVVGDDFGAVMVRKVPPRYVITFENKAEAQRFVRRWHRMPFKWSVGGVYENGEGPPQARAELLW
ncbi:hypothetical protein B0J12DRAFT_753890 [Macrophomina phaseolina]|uniref:Uncharacterized protein n=1 Tax=Macrophomina phaseolina TaxID=35725 RepID=A0ABQ8GDN4_9PEZI|nr:hypothetical protein B0J12DRAFT_753890 [Macrophomina phaseolina]